MAAMSTKRKTWVQKRDAAKAPHVVKLEKPFAGLPSGAALLISSPQEIDAYVRTLKPGQTGDVLAMRAALAKAHRAQTTCPLTTGIFLRIVAEAALEEIVAGKPDVASFWRIVDPKSPLAKKLSCGPDHIAALRAAEQG
jgi:hypothetical protein